MYNPTSQMWFAPDDEHYSLLHNCNHETASWLRALGCTIRGPAMFSNFKFAPPPASPAPTSPAATSPAATSPESGPAMATASAAPMSAGAMSAAPSAR